MAHSLTSSFRSHLPWSLFNLSDQALGLGHHGQWVPRWDAQIYHTTDKRPRGRIQGSCHCLVILSLATSKQKSLKRYGSQIIEASLQGETHWSVKSEKYAITFPTQGDSHCIKHYEIFGITTFTVSQVSLWHPSFFGGGAEYSCFTMLLVSTVQPSKSAIHIHIPPPSTFSEFPSHLSHQRAWSRVPCAVQ